MPALARLRTLYLLSSVPLAARSQTADPGTAGVGSEMLSPPVYGAYPTGGPVNGGTTVTIVGKDFGKINTVGLDRVRCSWGDPRPWQQAVFARQQAEMDGWTDGESALPSAPSSYFTFATRVRTEVAVTDALRATFSLPSGLRVVDLLECPSHEREAADVSLWFSLRFTETAAENATASRQEPNMMDTGFTYMYYPTPANFTNAAITGGPLHGGTSVVIEGSGFTRSYRSESDIDLSNLISERRRSRAHARRPSPAPPAGEISPPPQSATCAQRRALAVRAHTSRRVRAHLSPRSSGATRAAHGVGVHTTHSAHVTPTMGVPTTRARSHGARSLSSCAVRCRFTDKPSVVTFKVCAPEPASRFPGATLLSVLFDLPTNGVQVSPHRPMPPPRTARARRAIARRVSELARGS